MASERSKRRDLLALRFITKSISKKLLIKTKQINENNIIYLFRLNEKDRHNSIKLFLCDENGDFFQASSFQLLKLENLLR